MCFSERWWLMGELTQQIGTTGQHRLLIHPHHMSGELVGDIRTGLRRAEQIATRNVDIIGQHQGHRLAGLGARLIAIKRHDAGDVALLAGGGDDHGIPYRDGTTGDRAGKAAEIRIRPHHALHREAERLMRGVLRRVDGLEQMQQRRAFIPRRALGEAGDVVAEARRDRHGGGGGKAERGGKDRVIGGDAGEDGLGVFRQIDFVHRQQHVTDAEQRAYGAVASRLGLQAAARIHQNDGEIGGRGAGRHVARVLSRSASRPSVSKARSSSSPVVPWRAEALVSAVR